MKIVIDARMYGPKRWTGIGRYLQNLISQLEQQDHENEYIVLLGEENFEEYTPGAPNFTKLKAPFAIYSLGEQWGLWKLLKQLRPDVVHFAAFNAPVLWAGPRVTTVHDLTLLYYDTSRPGAKWLISQAKRLVSRWVMARSVRASLKVLTPTQFVKDQVCKQYHLAADRVSVTTLSVDPTMAQPEPIDRFGQLGKYLIYVGNCYPYKNVDRLFEALRLLGERQPDLRLVVVGRDDYFRLKLKRFANELGLAERIIFTGAVTDGELVSLYQGAALYVYPSISEGFGLQGLEAMAQGVPVLAAQASCLPETCGEAARYFDPYDVPALADMIDATLKDTALQASMKKAGTAHVQTFSWRRTAEQTLAAYRSLTR